MSDRQERVLDAAIEVVGARGLRALTHRAVDAEAALPAGSTSNLFRSRASLVAGVLGRLLDRETGAWTSGPAPPGDDAVESTVAALAERVRVLTGPLRALTITRFALYHEAALDPELARLVAESRCRVEQHICQWLARAGLELAPEAVAVLLSTVNGMLVERVSTAGQDTVDPAAALRLVLSGMVPAGSPAASGALASGRGAIL